MIRRLTGRLRRAATRHLHDLRFGVVAAALSLLFAAVSVGFATLAAYEFLRERQGPVVAALIVAAFYGVLAILIRVVASARLRTGRLRRAAAAPASPASLEALLASFAEASTAEEHLAFDAAMRVGRELSPMQLLAVALIGGFIAGRKLRK